MSAIYLIAVVAVLIYIWMIRRREHFRLFEKRNIPGPKPNFLFGNAFELYYKTSPVCYREWHEKFGEVFGFFNGALPVVVVCDKEIIKLVQIKSFTSFMDRGLLMGAAPRQKTLTQLNGQEWKHTRSTLTPSFTISKLKSVTKGVSEIVDEFQEHLEKAATDGKPFDIYKILQALTTDVICRIAMGINYGTLKNLDHPIIARLQSIFSINYNPILMVLLSFPQLFWLLPWARYFAELLGNKGDRFTNPGTAIMADCSKIIQMRRQNPKEKRNDLLQLLIDSKSQDTDVDKLTMDDDADQRETIKLSPSKTEAGLDDELILHNAWIVMIAGYETTSNTLSSISHVLMRNPDIQDKIRLELQENIKDKNNIDFETLQKLPYMEAVVKEALRMYSPVFQITRLALEDVQLPNGVAIKKDDLLLFPVNVIHHREDYFEEPKKFQPGRFLNGEVDPITFQAFGNGPRNCIGMRFAQMEIKLTLAKILLNYRLEPAPQTPTKIVLRTMVSLQRPADTIYAKVVKI